MIRVMFADDHAVVRAGLERLLASYDDVDLVGVAADGAEAVAVAEAQQPDVVLLDLSMPELDGIDATREILVRSPASRVVVLTSFSDRERILRALDAGAIGYVLKDAEPDELHRAVLAAARGESPLAPKAATAVLQARSAQTPRELTERELDVLRLVARGLPNKVIARQLAISDKTVRAHLTNVFRRIGVDDRTQAALWATQHGFGPEA